MAYQSKYKGVLVNPSDKETLNSFRALAPSLTEAGMMQFLLEHVNKESLTAFLLAEEERNVLKKHNVKSTKKEKKEPALAPAAKVARKKKETVAKVVSEKKVEEVSADDQVTEMHDADEPPIRVVVSG